MNPVGHGVFNVRDYGAIGNGTTNDTAAIQAALNAARTAGGGTVVIPLGTYAVNGFLVVFSNTRISAYGATIRSVATDMGILRNFLPTDSYPLYSGNSGIVVEGGIWDGNAADQGQGTVTGATNVMAFIHARDITIRDAVIRNISGAHGVEFNAIDSGRILNSRFEGFKDNTTAQDRGFSEAVQLDIARSGSSSLPPNDWTTCRNILIQGCWFGRSDRLGAAGRAIGGHTAETGRTYDNIQVIGCRIEGALQEGIQGFNWRYSVIADNVISGTGGTGILMAVTNPQVVDVSSVVIKGNVVTNAGPRPGTSGIRVEGNHLNRIPGVVIADNVVRDILGNGIQAEDCPEASISGNKVEATDSTGIYAVNSEGASVTGNVTSRTKSNGINIGGSIGATVSGNTIRTTTTNHGVYVGAGRAAAADVVISGNNIRGAAVAGIRLAAGSKDCTVTGNRVEATGGTQNGITLTADSTGAAVVGNDFSGNGWTAATAIVSAGSAPRLDWAGGGTAPGHNLI
ncbi:right-handed parallel beta-helix repeat-containing protein [Streptomyces sp. NPDC006798]|uniref:right-handed parallel beta-helix repeat-containing protein n=1 Tax=Streptomyces sp. NPDC006798 TaxID=3155462 RepID=UPI0034018BB7